MTRKAEARNFEIKNLGQLQVSNIEKVEVKKGVKIFGNVFGEVKQKGVEHVFVKEKFLSKVLEKCLFCRKDLCSIKDGD